MNKTGQNGTPLVPISEFCETGSGGTPSRAKADRYFGGPIPWVKSGELRESVITSTEETITKLGLQESAAKLLPPDTLLVALYGATVGRIGILGVAAATNQAVCHIIPNDREADRKYLYYALRAQVPYWLSKRVGVGQPNISQGVIKDTKIPLPPLPEQKRIADILDKADAIRRKRQEAIIWVDDIIKGCFYSLFGDPLHNSHNWVTEKLGNVAVLDRGRSRHRPRDAAFLYGGPYPFVQTGDITNSNGFVTSFTQSYSEDGLAQSKLWPAGTLCITIAANIAKTAVLTFDACFPDSVVGLLPSERVTTEYVRYWFVAMEKAIDAAATQVAQKNINLQILRDLDIQIPPLEQQRRFTETVSAVRGIREKTVTTLVESDNLFNSLVQRAFNGEL